MTDHHPNPSMPTDPERILAPEPAPVPDSSVEPPRSEQPPEPAEPPKPAEPEKSAEPVEPDTTERVIYRWNYAAGAAQNLKAPRRGLGVYAVVMTVVFLISFAMLILALWVGSRESAEPIRPGGISGIHDDVAIEGVEEARQSVTIIETDTGSGSGIILRSDGYIATNHHVIEDATFIKVTFYDGSVADAQVIGSSEADDLAVLKVDRRNLLPARFALYSECYVGQTVYAIGAPAGPEFGWTTTRGIISYKDREVKIYDDDDRTLLKKLRLLQTDANVNPGNSGGPLVNTEGEVIGVVSMKLSEGYEGIGFAIPADGAIEIFNAIIEGRDFDSSLSHKRPMLGVSCFNVRGGRYYLRDDNRFLEIPEDQLDRYKDRELIHPTATGVLIVEVVKGMDAYGKLKVGDVITAIDGQTVLTGEQMTAYINNLYIGDTVILTVEREGKSIDISLTLTAQAETD